MFLAGVAYLVYGEKVLSRPRDRDNPRARTPLSQLSRIVFGVQVSISGAVGDCFASSAYHLADRPRSIGNARDTFQRRVAAGQEGPSARHSSRGMACPG